jgi:hypothetical protein
VALTIVTTADRRVSPIMMQTPSFVENFICNVQKAAIGTTARMMSVIVVQALSQYEKSFMTCGLQHEPGKLVFHSFCIGWHMTKKISTDTKAKITWRTVMV